MHKSAYLWMPINISHHFVEIYISSFCFSWELVGFNYLISKGNQYHMTSNPGLHFHLSFPEISQMHTWWRHQMKTFSALLAICAGNSPVTGEFPAQRPVTRSFDVLLDLCLCKRLSKQSWGWWSETLSHPLWRHCNEIRLPADVTPLPIPPSFHHISDLR